MQKTNYVTVVYLSEDEETANYLEDILTDKKVEVHSYEKGEASDAEIARDVKDSNGLIILHVSDAFGFGEYLPEIKKAHQAHVQVTCCYAEKDNEQESCKYPVNEIQLVDGYPIENLANDICQIIVGGFNKVKINGFNRKKYRNLAFSLFSQESYVWSLCYLIKLFKIHDLEVKERIADAYQTLQDNDKAINYYSICLPLDLKESRGVSDDESRGIIYNNLGYLYTQTKNLEFAEKYLKKAIELKNPDALFNLGFLYESCWGYDSKKRRTKEGYDIYCKVLTEKYTSEGSKQRATEKLKRAADRLLRRKNYAAAKTYYMAIGDGAKAAECLRNIKRIRALYEERKRRQKTGGETAQVKKPVAKAEPKVNEVPKAKVIKRPTPQVEAKVEEKPTIKPAEVQVEKVETAKAPYEEAKVEETKVADAPVEEVTKTPTVEEANKETTDVADDTAHPALEDEE